MDIQTYLRPVTREMKKWIPDRIQAEEAATEFVVTSDGFRVLSLWFDDKGEIIGMERPIGSY